MLVVINVATFIYHMTASALFNGVGNAVSIVLILYSAHIWLDSSGRFTAASKYVVVATGLVALSFVANLTVASLIDSIKYLAIYVVYAAGRSCPIRQTTAETNCLYTLAALPIAFLLIGSSK
ncbi:hypothetical protein OO17_19600, partial [Rhodopseudomonas palustris]